MGTELQDLENKTKKIDFRDEDVPLASPMYY
jgi:hypothetical protein